MKESLEARPWQRRLGQGGESGRDPRGPRGQGKGAELISGPAWVGNFQSPLTAAPGQAPAGGWAASEVKEMGGTGGPVTAA